MLIDKYNRILIDKLPKEVAKELNQIAEDTENFTDEDIIEIYKENFNDLYKIVEEKYPEAIKPKPKLIKKGKSKLVKKQAPKKKLVKKDASKTKLVKKNEDILDLIGKTLRSEGKNKTSLYDVKDVKKIEEDNVKVTLQDGGIKITKSFTVLEIKSLLKGSEINHDSNKVQEYDSWKSKKNKRQAPATKDLNCDDAIKTIEKIEKTKTEAAKKRAEAPKKKVSTAVRDKQLKTISSILKMKPFKENKEAAEKFSLDLISAYKKSDFTDLFISNLKEDIDALIEAKYPVKKMNSGGQVEEQIDYFEQYDLLPAKMQEKLDEMNAEIEEVGSSQKTLDKWEKEFEKEGYSFEYGLDGEPYNLHKI